MNKSFIIDIYIIIQKIFLKLLIILTPKSVDQSSSLPSSLSSSTNFRACSSVSSSLSSASKSS